MAKSGHLGDASEPASSMLGGHAVLAVGYHGLESDASSSAIPGAPTGESSGYFTMPYPYLLQGTLASDFWTIRTVE